MVLLTRIRLRLSSMSHCDRNGSGLYGSSSVAYGVRRRHCSCESGFQNCHVCNRDAARLHTISTRQSVPRGASSLMQHCYGGARSRRRQTHWPVPSNCPPRYALVTGATLRRLKVTGIDIRLRLFHMCSSAVCNIPVPSRCLLIHASYDIQVWPNWPRSLAFRGCQNRA